MDEQNSYHLWITAIDSSLEAPIINKLVERGYAITPADGKNLSLRSANGISIVIALRVERISGEAFTATGFQNEVMDIIQSVGGKHYSVIVSAFSYDSSWCASHIEYGLLPSKEVVATEKKPN
jgi:hypothetical protein